MSHDASHSRSSGVPMRTIRDTWMQNLEKFPSKVAAICGDESLTYAESDLLADRLRRGLAERFGFEKGHKVALAGPNCMPYFIAYWAIMKSGGVAVPVNIRLGAEELGHLLRESDAEIILVHSSVRRLVEEALAGCPNVKHVVGMDFEDEGVVGYEGLVADGPSWDYLPELDEDDLGVIMFTSGTTGRPKGGTMHHGDLLFNNRLAVYAHSLRHEDVHMLVVPMFHATALYSLLPASALLGSTIVLAPKADSKALVELIQAHAITTFFGVPSLFRLVTALKNVADYDLSSIRLMAYAGAPMPVSTIQRLRDILPGVKLHNFFGLTETISMTHVLPDCDADTHPTSIGKLLPHVSQRILDNDGNEVGPGEIGELYFHRANIIRAYWKQPELLEKAMRGEWFNTGDRASVNADGFVFLHGRTKEMIIVGGENVYALEVENCIRTHPSVEAVAVIGIPATGARIHLGEMVKAVVVAVKGETLTVPDIKRHCVERLASYKVPQVVEFMDDLPRNAGGKVLKRELV
jgi:acyl-CoA synthetase (AMP-forming)/AMP-acid ligase II